MGESFRFAIYNVSEIERNGAREKKREMGISKTSESTIEGLRNPLVKRLHTVCYSRVVVAAANLRVHALRTVKHFYPTRLYRTEKLTTGK